MASESTLSSNELEVELVSESMENNTRITTLSPIRPTSLQSTSFNSSTPSSASSSPSLKYVYTSFPYNCVSYYLSLIYIYISHSLEPTCKKRRITVAEELRHLRQQKLVYYNQTLKLEEKKLETLQTSLDRRNALLEKYINAISRPNPSNDM